MQAETLDKSVSVKSGAAFLTQQPTLVHRMSRLNRDSPINYQSTSQIDERNSF